MPKRRSPDSYVAGEPIMMAFKVAPELKRWLIEGADATKRSLSPHTEMVLAQARDLEERLGGRRLMAVLENLAAAVISRYGNDDAWLDDPTERRRVQRMWARLLTELLPGFADAPAEIILRLPMTPEAARAAEELFERFAPPSWWGEPKGFEATDEAFPAAPSPQAQAFTDKVIADAPPQTRLDPETTGLAGLVVTIEPGFGAQYEQHDACVMVMQMHPRLSLAIVAVRPAPHLVVGRLSPANWRAVSQWIALNGPAIADHWNGLSDRAKLGRQLQRLPPETGA